MVRRFWQRVFGHFRKKQVEGEMEVEMRFHLDMETAENIRRGMSADEARRAARHVFGGVEQTKEFYRDVARFRWLEDLGQDLGFGARMLLKQPGFTLVAVLTLALGIGANTAIFTVVNAVLLRQLPYPQAERIVAVGAQFSSSPLNAVDDPRFLFWYEHQNSFEALAAHMGGGGVNLAGDGLPELVPAQRVSVDFFRVLGVAPVVGRSFTPEEDRNGGAKVVVLSDALWQRRYGGDRNLIGRTIALNGRSYTVIGVLPPDFGFYNTDVFTPLSPGTSGNAGFNLEVLGRLKAGVTPARALAEMKVIGEQLRAAQPQLMRKQESVNVQPYRETLTADARPLLLILSGAVGFVLLIACANVANLQLTQAAARHREVAVRMALGAGWRRIVRQLLTEGVLLALAGAALGLLLAAWGTKLLTQLMPEGLLPRSKEISFDGRVLLFTLAAAILTGLIFALAPAWQAARVDVNSTLKESAGKGAAGAGGKRLRGALVVAEVALALVLLAGASLLARTFVNLNRVAPGFDPYHVLTFQMTLTGQRYETIAGVSEFMERSFAKVRALPGVQTVALTNTLPLDAQYNFPFELESTPGQISAVQYRTITPDYFRAIGIGLKAGRLLSETDTAAAEKAVVVNEAFVKRYMADIANPLGQRVYIGKMFGFDQPWRIVGVVADAKQFDLQSAAPSTVFVPVLQLANAEGKFQSGQRALKFVVRTAGAPLQLSAAVRQVMLEIEPHLPLTRLRSMEQILARSMAQERFNMLLVGVFAALGLLLAAIGIYGVMAYAVAQRTPEIGLRMALGAQGRDVLSLVFKHGLALTLAGLGLGLAGAVALTRLMKSYLFGVSATDPVTFASVTFLLIIVALLACFLPARRATKVDPLVALRIQ
jgi:predicted permease